MAFATKGTWWRIQRESVAAENLRGVVNASVRWVFVGEDAGAPSIITVEAADAQELAPTFTARTPAGSDVLRDVAYVAVGVLVSACGANGVIETSANQGQTWSSINLAGNPELYGIVGVSGDALSRFVTVGAGEIWGQNSGGSWTQRWTGANTWRSVAHRAGHGWVAVADGGWGTHSPTGGLGTWTAPYSFGLANHVKIASNSSYFMAIDDGGYVYRSVTGLPGSWTLLTNLGTPLAALVPLLTSGSWAAFSAGFDQWLTTDDGTTWAKLTDDLKRQVLDAHTQGTTSLACGTNGSVFLSFDQAQEDFVSSAIEPSPPLAFSANPNMTADAVRRLVGQFRSST